VSSDSDSDTSCDDEATGEVSPDNVTSCDNEATENSTSEEASYVHSDNGAQESVAEMAIPGGLPNSTRGTPGNVRSDTNAQESDDTMTMPMSPGDSALERSSTPLQDQRGGKAEEIGASKLTPPEAECNEEEDALILTERFQVRFNDTLGTVILESSSWGDGSPCFSFVTPLWSGDHWEGPELIFSSHAAVDPALTDKQVKPIVHHVTIVLNDSGSHMAECHSLGFVLTFKVSIDRD